MEFEAFSPIGLEAPTPPKSEPFDDFEFPLLPDISPSPSNIFTPESELSCFMDSMPTPSSESASMTPSSSMSSMSPVTPDKKSNRKRKSVDQFPTPPSTAAALAAVTATTFNTASSTSTSSSSSSTTEKKPPKKRKSWGQELPIPTTNLPPRKRAKTEPEKEQRRVERVLRNRQAAQASRERKRQEYLAMEQKAAELESNNEVLKKENLDLSKRLSDMEARYKELERRMETMEKGSIAPVEPPTDFINELLQLHNMSQITPPSECTFDYSSSPTQSPGLKASSTADPSLSLGPLPDEHPSSNPSQALGMTHQSAELMCPPEDLQCLPRASTSLISDRFPAMWTIHCILFQILTSILYSIRQPLLPLFMILQDGKATLESLIPRFSPTNCKLMTKSTESILSHVRACSPALARLLSATSCAMRLELDKIDLCSSSPESAVLVEDIRDDQMEFGGNYINGFQSGIYGCTLEYTPDSFFEEFTWLNENGKAS
ncbi:transcription factor that binds to CRE motif [Rhizina undulata]